MDASYRGEKRASGGAKQAGKAAGEGASSGGQERRGGGARAGGAAADGGGVEGGNRPHDYQVEGKSVIKEEILPTLPPSPP